MAAEVYGQPEKPQLDSLPSQMVKRPIKTDRFGGEGV